MCTPMTCARVRLHPLTCSVGPAPHQEGVPKMLAAVRALTWHHLQSNVPCREDCTRELPHENIAADKIVAVVVDDHFVFTNDIDANQKRCSPIRHHIDCNSKWNLKHEESTLSSLQRQSHHQRRDRDANVRRLDRGVLILVCHWLKVFLSSRVPQNLRQRDLDLLNIH